jgi:small-conductance mechanosensitive channel
MSFDTFLSFFIELWSYDFARALLIVAGSVAAAFLGEALIRRTVLVITARTKTELDDLMAHAIRRPIFLSIIFGGVAWATSQLPLDENAVYVVFGLLKSLATIIWAIAALRIGIGLFRVLARNDKVRIVQPRTLPVFDIVVKLTAIAGGLYFFLLSWNINVTGWLASAGVLGIVLGLAAKDSLANLFAGIFILADAPYKVGDYIILDGEGGLRGQVTMIGIRSTRILTRDDIEVTVPNALMGSSKIVNESGGPHAKERIHVKICAPYGSDIDRVRDVLLSCADDPEVCKEPAPVVRLRNFGHSGLEFELLAWIDDPASRGPTISKLNASVYKAFARAGIEIPYSKHDVYIKQFGPSPQTSLEPRASASPDD